VSLDALEDHSTEHARPKARIARDIGVAWSVRLDVRIAETLLHLALSERTNAANSSGVSPATSEPVAITWFFTSAAL